MRHRESLAQSGGLTAHRFANGDLGKKLWLDLVSIQARESLEGAASTRTVRLVTGKCANAQQRDNGRRSALHKQLKAKSHRGLFGSFQKGGPLFPQEASNAPVLEDTHRSFPCP